MGISNTIPPSRLIQPGVVANTAARPTSPFTGQAIYQVDTNQMLIWNGTAWVIPNTPAQNPTGLELVTTATCSSGGTASGGVITIGSAVSSVVITNAFSATYDNYRIIISGTVVSSVGSSAFMTINGSTGATYSANGFYMAPSSGTLNGYSQNQTSAGFWLGVTGGTSSISLDIMNPFYRRRLLQHIYGGRQ